MPSSKVELPPLGKDRAGGSSSDGTTYTGSDTETMERESLFRANFLWLLNVVVTVVPSLEVVLPLLGKDGSRGRSSEGIMYTGSDKAMMETRERSAFATGLAREELTPRRVKMMALKSRGW